VIARAVRLAQSSSSTTSIVALVAFNLVPLAGVLFWGWSVATILVLYWLENGIVGLLNIPKMLLAAVPVPPERRLEVEGLGTVTVPSGAALMGKVGVVPFFLVHYGLFWFVHGVFVFALPQFAGAGFTGSVVTDPNGFPSGLLNDPGFVPPDPRLMPPIAGAPGPDWSAVIFGAIGLGISRVVSFFVNYVGQKEYLRVTPAQQMFAPYGRLVILHLTILFGAFVSLSMGSPVGAIVVLVAVKTAFDLALHVREHASRAPSSVATSGTSPLGIP